MDHLAPTAGLVAATPSAGAVITLLVILVSTVMFTIGWWLAAQKRYEAHRWVQTVAAILNAAVVLAWMITSFIDYVLPRIPDGLDDPTYSVTAVHAAVGIVGLVVGVFVALRGNELVPNALKFRNYKPYMRAAYALYMLGTLTGVVTYFVIYVSG